MNSAIRCWNQFKTLLFNTVNMQVAAVCNVACTYIRTRTPETTAVLCTHTHIHTHTQADHKHNCPLPLCSLAHLCNSVVTELKLEHLCGCNVGSSDGHHFHQLVVDGWSTEVLQWSTHSFTMGYTRGDTH